MRLSRFGIAILGFGLSLGVATAGNISFTGTFTQDDQTEIFLFAAPSASTLLRTWGYAGGTNINGGLIAAGGFDPYLSVFDATGGLVASSPLVASNDDGSGVAADAGNAFDSLLQLAGLNAGHTYALVLSQSNNAPNGTTYGEGFLHAGEPNFTASFCGGVSFCDVSGAQRTGSWAVDISGVRSAEDITGGGVPEPGTMLLLAGGMAGLALFGRRAKRV